MLKMCSLLVSLGFVITLAQIGQSQDDGWVKMFDGKSLDGWKANENADSWSVKDGMIACHGQRSHLFYVADEKPLKNFHFTSEVKTTKGSNSGIYFHTKFQESGWPKYGYECQVNVSQGDPKKTSGIYAVKDVTAKQLDYTEPENKPAFSNDFERRLGEGTFALQAHDPDSVVYFRNLKYKRLAD